MTISKEERAELRELADSTRLETDVAVYAIPRVIDALDAADERIKVLESEHRRALGLVDNGLAENVKCQELHERADARRLALIEEIASLQKRIAGLLEKAAVKAGLWPLEACKFYKGEDDE